MMRCADVEACAAEAALGLLTGGDRAAVLLHVEACGACRELVAGLSAVADELALVAPAAEPPAGFDARVLDRLAARPRRRGRGWRVAAIASVAAIAIAVAGFALGRAASSTGSGVHELAMRTSDGHVVGDAYLHGSGPAWIYVAVPGWQPRATDYRLRVRLADGTTNEVPGGDLAVGGGSWGTILPIDSTRVREVSLVGADGRVWCSGTA